MPPVERPQEGLSDDRMYRLLVEGITDYAIYMLNPDGIVISWNPGAQRFKGYQAGEIIGRHFSTFYSESDRKTNLPARALEAAAREGKFESEGWRIRKDGSRFWAYVVIDAIRSSSGELTGFAKITRDLSERRAAEESLKSSQQQFQLLVEGVTDYAIYMISPVGEINSWNAGAQRIKGLSSVEAIGTHFSRFYTEEDRAKGEPAIALEVAQREGRFEKEGWRVRKDGSRFWAHVVIDAIRAENGQLLGFAKVTRDVTARRDAQIELERARESLFQAQKMDAIGQLTGGVAHDFNNLLMAILGSLALLRKRLPDDPKLQSLLDNAVAGADRGTALTQRMLAFARRQDLNVESIDIPSLVREMSGLLDRSIDPSIELELRFPLALSPVQSDSNQLELALLNLVLNARDAMPRGGSIVVSARESQIIDAASGLVPGRYVCLAVTDTGEGMDEITMSRAIEPFFTTKGVGKGTGLGLPMVHGVAAQSGGRLVLKSAKGEGTTAELWLPVAMTTPSKTQACEQSDPAKTKPLAVLVVDDDFLVRINTVAMLEDLGHRVFSASSGTEALTILKSYAEIQLLITDQAMPQMTGAQLASAVKSAFPTLPIIMATGYGELPADAAPSLTKLAKPFGENELAVAIADVMSR